MMQRRVESQPLLADINANITNSRKSKYACIFLLVSQFLERISFYSLVCNLVYFLNKNPYVWDADNAMIATLIFTGISFCTAVFGGWLADSVLSKFRVITIGYLIATLFYIIFPMLYMNNATGEIQMTVAPFCVVRNKNKTSPPIWELVSYGPKGILADADVKSDNPDYVLSQENCSIWIIMALVGVGIGDAFVRSVISPFGADQLHYRDPEEVRTFFSWYYWVLNFGAMIAYVLFAFIQQNLNTFWGYMVPYLLLVTSAVVFVCGRPFYTNRPSHNTTLGDVFGVIGHGLKRQCDTSRSDQLVTHNLTPSSAPTQQPSNVWNKKPGCLSLAKIRYGGRFPETTVNDVRIFLQVFVILMCLIIYFVSYFQMESTFKTQGLHMLIQFPSSNFSIPVAWLSLCNVLTVIILLPVINSFVYPWLDRVRFSATLRSRMLTGMVFAVLAMLTAGIVEHFRLEMFWGVDNNSPLNPKHSNRQKIGNTTYYASNMPIYWQIPQYALVGLSEIFTSVAGLEFAYSHAPKSMQSLVTGIFWLVTGLGSLFGSLLLTLSRNILLFEEDYSDINCRIACKDDIHKTCHSCHLDFYFYALAILQIIGMGIYAMIAWCAMPRSRSALEVMRKVTHSSRNFQNGNGNQRRSSRSRMNKSVRRKRKVNGSASGSETMNSPNQQQSLFTDDVTFDTI